MACTVTTNRHGILTFRIYFEGRDIWKSTGKRNTPENRHEVEALAVIISKGIREGTFSLDWFQDEAEEKRPVKETVGSYYAQWIERKKPPVVRAGLERDYKEHFNRYILPRFRTVALGELSPTLLENFRAYLLHERGLAVKSVRNIIDASFRAMVRDWRDEEAFKPQPQLHADPFAILKWPRRQQERPDPFTEAERDVIIDHFAKRSRFYVPFVYTLFFTGARPSELLGLRWGDVDLKAGFLCISKSRYLDRDGATKTVGSDRTIRLLPSVVDLLKQIKPLNATDRGYVFLNKEGQPVNFRTWRKGVWYRILRGLEIRPRKPYCTRHTFISVGLSNGVNIKWLAEYCGTSVAMIEKHYGRYVRNDGAEQLLKLLGAVTPTVTLPKRKRAAVNEVFETKRETSWWAHLDSNQGPTGYEPVALTN